MTVETLKNHAAGILGCFVAVFVSVWVVHGSEQALKPAAFLVMVLIGIAAGVSPLVLPGARPDVSSKALTPWKAVLLTLGLVIFGCIIFAIGLIQ